MTDQVPDHNFAAMRSTMVSNQLRTAAVNDARVVDAMRVVPREAFVPPAQAAFAYTDRAVPLGGGRALNLPMSTGRMLTEAAPLPGDRALIVGAASGYTAALLALLVGSVVALEEDAALPAIARAAPAANVSAVTGPLVEGWAAAAPYDLIVIDGVVEAIPPAIVAQLADNGRLVAGLFDRGVARLVVGRRAGDGFGTIAFADAEAVPLPGFAKPAVFSF
ncbi:protein-L-isoaspartate O-methyltransferase family protein [Sphingomonas solaris]|uniref:Protein-L-isoaspartate O-methyltransferase n=1 Tax=Alterirhizorhabdus solaris TaxID=2529389 RepID=A0A558R147_9SPHN|nr:protein-L-isoaspartate O-methyltransferase [Sphingomonas solaris]TVV73103.1 protein-L-isoaspartate O-methyltransferase [Sphingomonas solaris]